MWIKMALAVGLCFALVKCGDDDDGGNDRVCKAGATKACACADGGEGVQTCLQDGSDWGVCSGCDVACDLNECLDDACPEELEVCSANADCVYLINCIAPCEDEACATDCELEYPDGVDDLLDFLYCAEENCSECEYSE